MYQEISVHTNTASPTPYFLYHYGRKFALRLTPDGWALDETWPEDLGAQPTAQQVLDWEPPAPEPPAPLTDLDRITKILAGHEAEAPQRITRLKAEVSLAMIAYAGFNPTSANAEGSRFVVHHAAKIAAFNLAGGNVVAGRALYDTIAESTGDFAWLNQEMGEGGPSILSIFAARLVAQ